MFGRSVPVKAFLTFSLEGTELQQREGRLQKIALGEKRLSENHVSVFLFSSFAELAVILKWLKQNPEC